MNSAIFAACADKPALHLELDEVDIVNSVIEASPNQSHTDEVLNPMISNDVRKLISMHDRGNIQAFEVKDTSYKAILSLAKHLGSVDGISRHNGLTPELLAQAIKFVKSVPAEQVFLRFEVTDKKPTIPNFNPAHMCAYDAERSYGTDYLQITRRLTIHGSTSSVMSHADLGTFLESGKRKCVVLYLGTQKNEDVEFLDPAHAMALDLVVTGLEQSEDVDELLEKADTILLHPEIAELHQEVTDLQITLTDFRNNLDPESGKDIAQRLLDLQNRIKDLLLTDTLAELVTPISGLVDSMLTDEMIKEVIDYYNLDVEASPPSSLELETLQVAIGFIMADHTLSAEEQGQKILALLQMEIPSLLKESSITVNQLTVFLENLQAALIGKKISLPVPLLEQPVMWELKHSEKLADLILLLSDSEHKDAIQEALRNSPEGMELLEALSRISETLNLGNIEKAVLIEKIHEALTATTPENAVLTSDLLRVMAFSHEPELISLAPAPVQLSVCSFTIDTLPAQHHLAAEGITEHIRQLTDIEHHLELITRASPTSSPPITLRSRDTVMTEPQNAPLGNIHTFSQDKTDSFNIIVKQVKDHPSVLDHLTPHNKVVVATIVAKSTLESLTGKIAFPLPLQHEIKEALQSSNTTKLVEVINKVVNTLPSHRQPPELATLANVTSYLNPTVHSATHVNTPFSPSGTENRGTQTSGNPDFFSSPIIPPRQDPKPHIHPVNDNPPPETQKTTPLKREFGKVCGKTGESGCNCGNEGSFLDKSNHDNFKETVENLKIGEETKLENGTTIEAIKTRIKKDGATETIFAWKDGNTTVFEGTIDDIQQQKIKNAEEVKKNADRYESKFEKEPVHTETTFSPSKEQINITLTEPSDNTGNASPSGSLFDDADFDPSFGDEDHHITPPHQPSGFSPR